jgi:hypothetical protein
LEVTFLVCLRVHGQRQQQEQYESHVGDLETTTGKNITERLAARQANAANVARDKACNRAASGRSRS